MLLLRLLVYIAFAIVVGGTTSCSLLVEAAITESREGRKLAPGSKVESRSFTVEVPNYPLYIKHFDKSKEVLMLADTSAEALGNEYYVFPIDAAPGESASTALLGHYAKYSPRGHRQVVATRPGKVRGSAGQVDLITQGSADGGHALVTECIRSGNRMWVAGHLFRYPGKWNPEKRSMLPWMHESLAPFARSLRLK